MRDLLVNSQAGTLTGNFDEVAAYLDEQLAIYKGMVFTEDSKADAKKTVAELRKGQKAITETVKKVKAEYMAPFDAFSDKAMELAGKFEEPITFINGQVAEFEAKRIEEKKAEINEAYEYLVPAEWRENLPLRRIYNDKWQNATYKMTDVKRDIAEALEKVKKGASTIEAMGSEITDKALSMYFATFDLEDAINMITRYEKQKAEILEAEKEKLRRAEEERIRAEERAKIAAEAEKAAAVEEAKAEAAEDLVERLTPAENDTEVEIYTYCLKLSKSAKEVLEMYMDSVGIDYEELTF